MILRVVFTSFLIFINLQMAFAEQCFEIGKRCVEGPSTKTIDKFEMYQECWQYETIYECISSEYIDYCASIKSAPGCEQISGICKEMGKDGQCLEYVDRYQCGNLLKSPDEIKFLNSEYTVVKDELNTKDCDPNEINPNCKEVEQVCVEGAETRNINGKDVHKECWKYEKKYSCFVGSGISDCDEFKDKCELVGETCLSEGKDGVCKHVEKTYECVELAGKMPLSMSCKTAKYCIGGSCEETTYESNKNMGRAISALSILNNLKNEFNEQECKAGAGACKTFKGENQYCKINPFSARNCCKNKGWLKDLGLASCSAREKALAKNKENKKCHHIGSYCKKKIGGICIEKRQSYCCFNSKLARIIQEQGRGQLGISWGSAKEPNCQALSIEQLQRIDFNKVDLREFYSDAVANFKMENHHKIQELSEKSLKDKTLQLDNQRNEKSYVGSSDYQEEISRRIKDHYGK